MDNIQKSRDTVVSRAKYTRSETDRDSFTRRDGLRVLEMLRSHITSERIKF